MQIPILWLLREIWEARERKLFSPHMEPTCANHAGKAVLETVAIHLLQNAVEQQTIYQLVFMLKTNK